MSKSERIEEERARKQQVAALLVLRRQMTAVHVKFAEGGTQGTGRSRACCKRSGAVDAPAQASFGAADERVFEKTFLV